MYYILRYLLLLWLFSLSVTDSIANALTDSLEIVLAKEALKKEDRVAVLNQLAWQYIRSQPELAEERAREAQTLAIEVGDKKGESLSLKRLGTLAKNQGRYKEAIAFFQGALQLEIALDDTLGMASAYNGLGIVSNKLGAYIEALNYYAKYLELQEQLKNAKRIAIAHNNLGNVYLNRSNFELALQNYLKGLKVLEEIGDSSGMASAYNNLGILYEKQQSFDKAIDQHKMALAIYSSLDDREGEAISRNNLGIVYFHQKDYPAAIKEYQLSLRIKQEMGDQIGETNVLNQLGLIHQVLGHWALAEEFFQQGLSQRQQLGDLEGIAVSYINLGQLNMLSGKTTEAVEHYLAARNVATEIGALELMQQTNQLLGDLMEEMGDMEQALFYFKESAALEDSIYNERSGRLIQEMQTRYETEKKEQTIRLQEEALGRQKAENNWLYALTALFFMLVIVLLLSIYSYRSRQQTQQLLSEQKEEQHKQKVRQLLQEQELQSIHARLEGQEKERKRIARDLHDRLGSILSTIKYLYSNREQEVEGQEERIDQLIDEACDAVRKVAHNILAETLNAFGLEAALKELTEHLRSGQQIDIQLIVHDQDQRLARSLEIEVYRIIQELLSNVLRHARAKQVIISLTRQEEMLNIMVEDNGIGYEVNSIKKGMGLANLNERLKKVKGGIEVDSVIGRGTIVMIDLPLTVAPVVSIDIET